MTLRPKVREQNPDELRDENSPMVTPVNFDRNITGVNSQRINLVMILVTIVHDWHDLCRIRGVLLQGAVRQTGVFEHPSPWFFQWKKVKTW